MKAAVLYGVGDLRVVERETPTPAAGETLVRVRRAQVSVSEVNKFKGIRPLGPTGYHGGKVPIVPGHEFSAEVIKLQGASGDIAVGDKVVADDHVPCGKCYYCRKNMTHLCSNDKVVGSDMDGAFQEFAVLRTDTLFKVPDEVSYEEAAFVEPLSTCVEAVERSGVKKGETAVILGQGLMGLMLVQLLKLVGARTIGTDLMKHRLDLSERLGVDLAIDVNKENVVKRVMDTTGGIGADVVFEASGVPAAFEQAFDIARRGATLVQIGHIWSQRPSFPALDFYFKDLKIVSARGYSCPKAIDVLKNYGIETKALITHIFTLDKIAEAYEARTRNDAIVVQLQISEP